MRPGVLALTMAIAGVAEVSAHRRDEYLQAARLAIDPGRVQLELDLTPGIALAEAIIADIDRNGDGSLSREEQRAYGGLVMSALTLEVDGIPVRAQPGDTSFPDAEAMRRGEGTIRIQSAATLPRLAIGPHQLLFRNSHHPDRSVYLANALVPGSDEVAITAQRRDGDQTELTIEYVLRAAPADVDGRVAAGQHRRRDGAVGDADPALTIRGVTPGRRRSAYRRFSFRILRRVRLRRTLTVRLKPDTTYEHTTYEHTTLSREGRQRRRGIGRQRCPRRVQHHRDQRVPATQADRVHHALLAEFRQRPGVGGVADAAVAVQLDAEIVERRFVVRHLVGAAAFGDRLRDLRIEAAFDRQ